jgi:hypothetical protein
VGELGADGEGMVMTQALPFCQLFEIIRKAQPARRID